MNRHITWNNFEERYVTPKMAGYYQLEGEVPVRLYVTEKATELGITIGLDAPVDIKPLPFAQISLSQTFEKGKYSISFSTTNKFIFFHFYSLIVSISDSVQLDGQSPIVAIWKAIDHLKLMLSTIGIISEEKVVGLWGELHVLLLLVKKYGHEAVYYWKGADKAVHDFRYNDLELEVKTTRSEDRKHMISRLSQLDASPNHKLYICSIQVAENSSNGQTLPGKIDEVTKYLNDISSLEYFNMQLGKEDYKPELSVHYTNKYYLRSEIELIEVTDSIPRINFEILSQAWGKDMARRIDDSHYRLDVAGLGFGRDDKRFDSVL